MAALTITSTNVKESEKVRKAYAVAGETLTPGQPIYLDASDSGKAKKASSAAASTAVAVGVVLAGGASGQTIVYAKGGKLAIGATVVVSETYVLGAAGAIKPIGDLDDEFVTRIGLGASTTEIELDIKATGLEAPDVV